MGADNSKEVDAKWGNHHPSEKEEPVRKTLPQGETPRAPPPPVPVPVSEPPASARSVAQEPAAATAAEKKE